MFRFIAISLLFISTATFASIKVDFRDLSLSEFAAWYSDYVDMPVVVDSRLIDSKVSVYNGDVTRDELPDFFRSVLNAHGYEISGYSPALIFPIREKVIHSSPVDIESVPDEYASVASGYFPTDGASQPEQIDKFADYVSQVVSFNYVRASDLVDLATHFLSYSGDEGIKVSVIDSTNSLMISGPKRLVDEFVSRRDDIDQPHPQVFIKAVFYEVSAGESFDLGVAYGARSRVDGPSFSLNGAALGDRLSGVGAAFGIFDSGMLDFAVNAISQDNSAKLLSTPQILTLSGRNGIITVGQNVPVITGKATGEAANVNSPFQTIERRDVGLYLDVRPVVLSDDSIVIDVLAKSDSVSNSTIASDIITNQRNLSTTVRIRNGQTIFLGGLITDDKKQSDSGIPFLKDLPFVGAAFRSSGASEESRTLNVLIEAYIIQ